MKRMFAWIFAIVSGLYLLIMGPMVGPLDPVPVIDEAVALAIFLKSTSFLGFDFRRFIPFLRKRGGTPPKGRPPADTAIDV
jgi:hypothetical protein